MLLDHLKGLIANIKFKFREKRIIRRKSHFDENVNDEIAH